MSHALIKASRLHYKDITHLKTAEKESLLKLGDIVYFYAKAENGVGGTNILEGKGIYIECCINSASEYPIVIKSIKPKTIPEDFRADDGDNTAALRFDEIIGIENGRS